jgi:hypothetical protein
MLDLQPDARLSLNAPPGALYYRKSSGSKNARPINALAYRI